MKKATLSLLSICFGMMYLNVHSQEAESTGPKTIDEQFTEMVSSSNSFEDYKVIKKYKVAALQKNTKDRIDGLQKEIETLNTQIANQKSEVEKLNTSLASTQTTLENTNKEKDSMNFFGVQMTKGNYQTMVWSIAGILLLGLLLFIFRFKNSNALTRQAQHKLGELELEFDDYKRKALEKEQKLGRQLQDERNKALKTAKS